MLRFTRKNQWGWLDGSGTIDLFDDGMACGIIYICILMPIHIIAVV